MWTRIWSHALGQIEDKDAQIRRLEALLKPEGEVLHVKEFEVGLQLLY